MSTVRLRDSGVFLLAVAAGVTGGITILACCCAGLLQILTWTQELTGMDGLCAR